MTAVLGFAPAGYRQAQAQKLAEERAQWAQYVREVLSGRLPEPDAPADWAWIYDPGTRAYGAIDDVHALRAWWSGLGKDRRVFARASIRATRSLGGTPAERIAAWGRMSPSRRQSRRRAHGLSGGLLDDAAGVYRSVARPVLRTVAPIASQVASAVPGVGPVVARGITQTARALEDPRKAVAMAALTTLAPVFAETVPGGAFARDAAVRASQSIADAPGGFATEPKQWVSQLAPQGAAAFGGSRALCGAHDMWRRGL